MNNSLLINLSFIFSKPTGISNYALNLFPTLKSLNPTLLSTQSFPDFNSYHIPDNLTPAQGSKGHFRRLLWTQFQLPKIYDHLKASLLFSPVPEAPLYSNCRSIIMVHDLIPLRFPNALSPLTYYFRYYLPLVLKQAEHIICNSQATANDIGDFFGISTNKITPILLAYDKQHFYPRNVPANQPYFLYLGRQDPYKNLERLIKSFALLPQREYYQLWLAGSCDRRFTPLLKSLIKELQIPHLVRFLDYISYEELPSIISQARALVFPSLWEGFGLPVLESMACGTPVITSNLASLPEVTGDAAILLDPYNIAEITAAMEAIATDNQLRNELSKKSIMRASFFSWEKTGNQTLSILNKYL